MAVYLPNLSKGPKVCKKLPLTPLPPQIYCSLDYKNSSKGWYKCIYKYPKTTLVGDTLRPLGMGPPNGLGYLWGYFQLTSWKELPLAKEFFFFENIYTP